MKKNKKNKKAEEHKKMYFQLSEFNEILKKTNMLLDLEIENKVKKLDALSFTEDLILDFIFEESFTVDEIIEFIQLNIKDEEMKLETITHFQEFKDYIEEEIEEE